MQSIPESDRDVVTQTVAISNISRTPIKTHYDPLWESENAVTGVFRRYALL